MIHFIYIYIKLSYNIFTINLMHIIITFNVSNNVYLYVKIFYKSISKFKLQEFYCLRFHYKTFLSIKFREKNS